MNVSALDTISVTAATTLSGRGAFVDITGPASGTYAITVPAPTSPGESLTLSMSSIAGTSVTVALTNFVGGSAGTSALFNAAGESLFAIADANGKWVIIKEQGVTLS